MPHQSCILKGYCFVNKLTSRNAFYYVHDVHATIQILTRTKTTIFTLLSTDTQIYIIQLHEKKRALLLPLVRKLNI